MILCPLLLNIKPLFSSLISVKELERFLKSVFSSSRTASPRSFTLK